MSRKILSINGNKSMNYMLQTVFSSKKYKLIPVSNALDGMSVLKRQKEIELIIIDLDYNSEENLDFIRHISNSWLYLRPIVILKSGEIENGILSPNISYDFYLKPFSPVHLLKAVDSLLVPQSLVAY